MVAATAGSKIRGKGNKVWGNAIAHITDVAGKILIGGIAGGIKGDFPTGDVFGPVDGELKAAIERQFRADDLIGKRGALHQILAAVDIAFRNEIGDDISAAFLHLLRSQLQGFIHERKERGRSMG